MELLHVLIRCAGSHGSNMERARVDLYGYASMALSTVQKQQKEIDALRHEVDELRRTLERRER